MSTLTRVARARGSIAPHLTASATPHARARFDVLGVYSPDRLARRHAYQILLLEELRKAARAVEFIERPISDDPHDQLLLPIPGAIAEYERAVLAERFRRGKLQKARAGSWGAGRAPSGSRYIPQRDGVPGHLEVQEAEVEESLRAAASCSCKRATMALRVSTCALRASSCVCWASSRACGRWQFGHRALRLVPMAVNITSCTSGKPHR
jgi:Resolvase, N terminal domain